MSASADRPPLVPRQEATRRRLEALGLERLLVTSLTNVTWLTGFEGSAAAALVEPDRVVLVTDRRYEEAAADLAGPGLEVVLVEQTYDETLVPLIGSRTGGTGYEAVHLSAQRLRWLVAALAARRWPAEIYFHPTVDLVEAGRIIKDEWEVAQALEAGLRRTGAVRPAFDTIVASGPRSALPHGKAATRVLEAGDLVVLDFGGVYGGYCVDLTRTVELAPGAPEAARVHAAVAEAQRAAIAAIRPGIAFTEADRAAREILADAGLANRFVHGTGHGLGLEVHEAPRLGPARSPGPAGPLLRGTVTMPETFAPGMVVTVEPGIYIPGWGGVRIEDDVLVTAEGAERLTDAPIALASGD